MTRRATTRPTRRPARRGRGARRSRADPTPAVSNSRRTASGVTTPRVARWSSNAAFCRCPIGATSDHYRNFGVDIDGYIAHNEVDWRRLDELTRRRPTAGREPATDRAGRAGPAIPAGLRAIVLRPYELSGPTLTARLTRLVAAASGVIYGKRARSLNVLRTFFTISFPAAVLVPTAGDRHRGGPVPGARRWSCAFGCSTIP